MMKKRIILIFGLMITLAACAEKQTDEVIVEHDSLQTQDTTVSLESFVIDTFREYGKDVQESDFQIQKQGQVIRAVVIKEPQDRAKPLISKLIFLERNGNLEPQFLMIDNVIQIDR